MFYRLLGITAINKRSAGRWAGGCFMAVMLWGGTAPLFGQTHTRPHAQTALEIPAPMASGREQIIYHIGYTVSYNGQRRLPNWVAYELTPEETTGPAARQNRFVPDPEVPPHESATSDDYKHSGYDRGHMAPAADMKWSEQAMKESFYLSNICPQHPALNRGIWKQLEDLVRRQAATRGSVYVVCGPIAAGDARRIGGQGVAVPHGFFKALLQEAGGEWSAIGFVFENGDAAAGRAATEDAAGRAAGAGGQTVASGAAGAAGASEVVGGRPVGGLWVHTLTIDSLERLTGMDFFPALPDSIETAVEREVDLGWWGL